MVTLISSMTCCEHKQEIGKVIVRELIVFPQQDWMAILCHTELRIKHLETTVSKQQGLRMKHCIVQLEIYSVFESTISQSVQLLKKRTNLYLKNILRMLYILIILGKLIILK